ncbi:disease resistance protein RPM1-like [Trifolium pratense]|uniref:disease resistance protein RPM1-like n=1 Tax=Trifolium pratense TaxID=57577 RepID=UPI001E696261|nr:disease resistance protein RPM1-like [Trifolium pratense]
MADSSVSFLLDKLSWLLQEEVNLQKGVREDVQYIKDELERHKAILMVADSLEHKDPELKVWLKSVRNIAQDMEDAIDEYNLRLVDHHQQGKNNSSIHKLAFGFKTMKARHRIATDIQGIKSKVENISHGRPNISGVGSSSSQRRSSRLDSQGDALLLEEADLVGIEEPKKQLCDLLFKDESNRAVISIHGMGGLGKTTLAKQVYEDPKVKKYFRIHAWVNLSQSFNMEEILKDLAQQLHNVIGKPAPESIGMMKIDNLKEFIKNFLQRSKKYLIVLDDVWHVNVWDAVKLALPNNNCGSRVILTTRKKDVALYSCAELGKDFHPEFLPRQEAWSLFCRKTFQGNSCPPHLEEVCRKILKLCGGLPLAIVAISGALATRERSNIEEWNMVCRSFGSEIEGNDILEVMKKVLSLSFNELPYYLKSCLMYLTVFPEFHAIEHMRLIRLWIAEGFVKDEDGKTPEEVADSYLKELLNRSLIQVVEKTSDGRMNTCRMHGLTREIVNLKSRDQNFATIAKDKDMVWPERVRRLSVINSSQNVFQQNKTTFQLRSLLMFAVSDSPNNFSIHDVCTSSGAKLLTVLDLQDAPLEAFPAEIVNLYLLKYLSLKNTKVKNIPGSIKKLQYLETLDLKHTGVTELPAEIAELKRLRHLLVYRYDIESYAHFHSRHGFKVAAPIGNMLSLQKLCFIEVDQGSGALMVELGKLTQLRRLGIRKMRKEDGAALCSSIEKMVNLTSLSITAINEDEIIDIHSISKPPQYLQKLYLSGRLEKFPQWIKSCKNLVRVFLKWSRLKEDPLVYLQDLPNLRHLEFLQAYVGETLQFNAKGFPSLKMLGLDDLKGLKYMIIEEEAMQGLKKLVIQQCGSFKNVPLGIEYLTKLKAIELFDMPIELIMALRPNGGEDYWRVQNIPTIYSTYWRDHGWDVYPIKTFGEIESDIDHSIALRTLQLPTLSKV